MSVLYTDIYEQFNRQRVVKLAYDPDYSSTAITSGSLTKEKRYEFITAGSGADFSNVGLTEAIAIGVNFYCTLTAAPTAWGGASIYVGMSPSDIVENEIANTRNKFTAIANYCDVDFTESDEQIALAMKYFTMYLLTVRNQNEKQGEEEYKFAISLLVEKWGDSVTGYLKGNQKISEFENPVREKIAEVSNIDYEDDDIEDWL